MVGTANDYKELERELAKAGLTCWEIDKLKDSPKKEPKDYELDDTESDVPQIKLSQTVTRKQLGDFFEEEFYDIILPLVLGAKKGYEKDNWLKPDGIGASHKDNFGSIFRHVSEASVGMDKVHDADIDPRLCAACRLMMDYVRDKRGIKHIED